MQNKRTVVWPNHAVCAFEHPRIDMTHTSDVILVLLGALLALPCVLGICLRHPALVTLMLIGVLCLFSSSTWGQLQEENTVYSRGTGVFYFSLLNLLLWAATAAACLQRLHLGWLRDRYRPLNTTSPFPVALAAFAFMLLAHVALGLMSGQDLLHILSYTGLINVINLLLFGWLITQTLADSRSQRWLLQLLLALAAARATFGLARYQWLGGDSANPYRNFEGLDIRLVFFDICDNYLAALAAFMLAWLLLMPQVRLSLFKRALLLLWLALEVATVALSFRRSSLIGLALMSLVLFWQLPWRRRLWLAGTGSLGMITASIALLKERLQFNTNDGGSALASLLYDIGPAHSTEVSRFYELEAAAQSLEGHWLFGLGSWGSFYGNEDILDYHFGKFDFVHSGFGHVLLKSGLVGLMMFMALLAAVVVHYLRQRRLWRGHSALMADAAMAGLLFWTPTLLIGTPVIEFRTMLLLGLTLALPYLCAPPARPQSFHFSPRRSGHVAA